MGIPGRFWRSGKLSHRENSPRLTSTFLAIASVSRSMVKPTFGRELPYLQDSIAHYAAKDLLRASHLPLLGSDDSEVAADLKKVSLEAKLSPVLLVEGDPLWVADGYHRICASYHIDEKAEVPCRIVPRVKPDEAGAARRPSLQGPFA